MKKMNIVRNTITEGTETYRERSRIGSINHRIWSVIAPMLFIAFGLFGVNEKAWGTCYIHEQSGTKNTEIKRKKTGDIYSETFTLAPAGEISFTYKNDAWIDGNGSNFKITYQKEDGTWGTLASNVPMHKNATVYPGNTGCSASFNGTKIKAIKLTTISTDGVGRTYSISNLKITRYAELIVSSSSEDMSSVKIDSTATRTFTISAYNLSGTPTASFVSGADAAFSKSNVTYNNNDCPKTWSVTVSYNPTCANTSELEQKKCTLRVSLDGKTKDIVVTATPTLRSQTVNWALGNATSLVAGTSLDVAGFATSTSNIDGKPAIYYTSKNTDVINVAADGHTLIANEEKAGFSATITAHQDADCKYGEATADQVFTVTAKDRPEFTLYIGGVATEATSANLKVGDVVEIHYANAPNLQVSGGSSTTFTHSKNTTSKIVTITAQGVCTNGELTLYESGNTYVEAREATFTFNISKHETDLSSLLDVNDFYVGNSVYAATAHDFENGTAYNTNNTEVDVQFSSTNENVINIVDGKIKAKAAGDATIKMWQASNNKWTGDTVIQAITVKKHSATFGWNVEENYTWNQSISNPFTTDNHDTQITCVSDDTNVADYVDGKVVIYNVTGTAHFTLHQAGNDVWKETEQQYTVNVAKVNKHVPFTLNQSLYNTLKDDNKSSGSYSWNGEIKIESGGFDWGDKYVVIGPFEGVPYQLTCNYSCDGASTGRGWQIFESSDGSSWGSAILSESSAGTCTNKELKASTRYLKFVWSGNLNGYFSNISVSERREVKPHGSADVDCGTANHGSDATEATAILEWYNVKPLTCSITSDHPEAFELVTTSIDSKLDTYKKNQEITIRGKHDVTAGKYTGTLHVTNGIESTTFNLTTTTTKQTPVIKWKDDLSPLSVGDIVPDAASAGSATIKYTVDGTYLTLDENGAVVATNATDADGIDLIAYVEEDETWKAASETIKVVVTNLQKQTITWTDKLSFKFTGTKVIDLTATSSSGVEITYELSGTGNYATLDNANKKLTVTGIGSSLYLTAKTVDNDEYYPAARTKTINSRDPNASCASHVLYEDKEEKTLHTIDWEEISWDLEEGEPGVISFRIKRMLAAAGDMALEEWYDNDWHRVKTYSVSTTYATKTETLSRKATKARIGAPFGATLQHYVDDIVLYQAKYCELSETKLDFGTVTMGTAPTMSFTVHYSNLEKSLDIELENENTQFSVDKIYIGDDCGEHGTVTVTVTYNAANYVESESTNLVISNTEYNKTVSLKALIKKASQTITWNPASLDLKTTDDVTFDAVTTDAAAATGIVVTYAVKGTSDVATVTSDGHLTILKDGSVTIVASAEGNSQYEDATQVEKTFTISKVTPTITNNPTINSITLPATLADVTIGTDGTAKDDKNTVVTGTFTWQTSGTKVLSGANDYTIVFTPDQPAGKDWYNTKTYNISVTGIKDSQEITWTRADETTQPCSTPTTFDASSNRGLTISYSSSDESVARVEKVGEEYRLVVLTSGTVDITASQSGNGDYEAATPKTKRITLTKEQPEIVTPPTAEAIFTDNHLYDAGLSGGEGQVNGVHAEGIFSWKNGDIQPEAGTHTYTAIFTPSPAAWYYPAECQVSVTVSKHPQTVNWAYTGGTIYVNEDDLYFTGATSTAEIEVYYTTSNTSIAEVDAEHGNKLIIHGKGDIDIIARTVEHAHYVTAEKRVALKILPLETTGMNAPTAAGITYGQALSTSALSGGLVKGSDDAVLDGTWAWNDDTEILNADENAQSREVTFTPNDSHWYASATTNASVVVAKAEPTTVSATTTIIYGQLLSEATLVNTTTGVFGEAVSGNVVWATSVDQSEALEIGTHNVAIHFTSASNNYTDGDGECVVTVMEGVVFKGGTNTSWGEEGNWINGNQPTNSDRVTVDADVEITSNVTIGGITINAGNTVTVKSGATLTIGDKDSYVRGEYGSIHVENGGNLNLTGGRLAVKDFTLDAQLGNTTNDLTSPSASGQVLGANKLDVNGDAFFQLAVDPCGHNTYGWYDFVVPFEVDVIGGISIAEAPTTPMQFNVNYAVMAYDESKRAVKGKDWNKFSGTMQPGRVYTITLDETQPWNTVIFKKKKGAAITGDRSFTTSYSGLGETKDNGWNGFGNGSLQHMELDVTDPETLVQIYDHANKCYQPRLAKDRSIAVGLSFFMQVGGVETIELSPAVGNDRFMAPTRTKASVDKFCLALKADEEEQASDYFWVSANEEATGEYVIGRDVLKMGALTSSKVARIWSNRNDINLCSNDIPMVDNQANCSISLFAPQAKTYTLSVENTPEDATLYLTYNDRIIWSLSASPYVIDLEKGTTEGYGLRIVTTSRMPEIATGVESLDAEQGAGMRKVMIDNKIYIITPEGAMYDVTGKILR